MVWPAPSTVTPLGTVSGAVVSQSALIVKVVPLVVPAHTAVMSPPFTVAPALPERVRETRTEEGTSNAHAKNARNRTTPITCFHPPPRHRGYSSWLGSKRVRSCLSPFFVGPLVF